MRRTLAAIAAAAATVVTWTIDANAATTGASDPEATGQILLCSPQGKPETSGLLDSEPLAWTAVSSAAAPNGYAHGKATLYAYQPRAGIDPGDWSGMQMTGTSTFTDGAHPLVQSTPSDYSLGAFVRDYPPQEGGLVELRIGYTAAGQPFSSAYPAVFLQVTGSNWKVLGPVPSFGCGLGTGVSDETQVLGPTVADKPQPGGVPLPGIPTTSKPATSPPSSRSVIPSGSSTTTVSGPETTSPPTSSITSAHADAAGARRKVGGGNDTSNILILGIVAVVVLAGVATFARWRRFARR